MDKKTELLALIPEQGIVPLYYAEDLHVSLRLMEALYGAGIRTTEYADRGSAALRNFREMRKICDSELPGMFLGIGTVKNVESARAYIDAGADFIISPGMLEPVFEEADKHGLLCVPGCMTPTEIIRAESLGARIVKLFPANSLAPSFLDAIQALFQGLLFMPTGGIELDEENLMTWFKRGVCAVGGSKLITSEIIKDGRYEELTVHAEQALRLIKSVREGLEV